jgi:hypothetical protein
MERGGKCFNVEGGGMMRGWTNNSDGKATREKGGKEIKI